MDEEDVGCIAMIVIVALAIVALVVFGQKYEKESCAELHRVYGQGRCVFGRDEPKLVLPDGTVRYLPQKLEEDR